MAKIKVFGGLVFRGDKQVRAIVASTSKAKAAAAVDESPHQFGNFWCETGNQKELQIALANPGQVFVASSSMGKDFSPIVLVGGAWCDADIPRQPTPPAKEQQP